MAVPIKAAVPNDDTTMRVLELMDRFCLKAVNQATDLNLPEAEAMLLIETDGFTQAEADGQMEVVLSALRRNDAGDIVRAATAAESAKLWAARKGIYGIITRLNYKFHQVATFFGRNPVVDRLSVAGVGQITDCLEYAATFSLLPELG